MQAAVAASVAVVAGRRGVCGARHPNSPVMLFDDASSAELIMAAAIVVLIRYYLSREPNVSSFRCGIFICLLQTLPTTILEGVQRRRDAATPQCSYKRRIKHRIKYRQLPPDLYRPFCCNIPQMCLTERAGNRRGFKIRQRVKNGGNQGCKVLQEI